LEVFGFAAYPGNGKTTLIENLIPLLTARGLKVGVIKRTHHALDIDQPGKDSHRLRQAGAAEVLVSSAGRWVLVHEQEDQSEPGLSYLLGTLAPCGLVLVEGFKTEPMPKVEVHRGGGAGTPLLLPQDSHIVALATDVPIATGLPVFGLGDHAAIAGFLVGHPGLA